MFNSQAPSPDDLPSSAQLIKSTIVSALAAGAILVTIVLPSEYAIDPTGIGSVLGLTSMGEIKKQLAEEAQKDSFNTNKKHFFTNSATVEHAGYGLLDRLIREFGVSSAHAQEMARKDELSVVLKPGEGTEVKLVMKKDAVVNYTWTANGGQVNFDAHGDGTGESISYKKGRGAPEDSGTLTAAFDGNHGWFWRNRMSDPVRISLTVEGAYTEIKK